MNMLDRGIISNNIYRMFMFIKIKYWEKTKKKWVKGMEKKRMRGYRLQLEMKGGVGRW